MGKQTQTGRIRRRSRPGAVTRGAFVRELGRDGGAINVHELGRALVSALARAGLTPEELAEIAGRDGQIRGAAELGRLFALVDRADRDGSPRAIRTAAPATGDERETQSGALFEALVEEAEEHRRAAKRRGVIHVGMREESRAEVGALRRGARGQGGVHAIEAYASDGVLELGGETYDLGSPAGLAGFKEACVKEGMSGGQAARFASLLGRESAASRDELAKLGLAIYHVGTGELPANRLVLSGHSAGDRVFGLLGGSVKFETVGELAEIFPEGAAGIEHVAVAACNAGYSWHVDQFRAMFPHLKSYFGYGGFAPKAEKGSPAHLRHWEARTDGDDPSRVDPIPKTSSTTWNVADGFQGREESVEELERVLWSQREAWEVYERGERVPRPGHPDQALDRYYLAVVRLLGSRELDPDRRAELEAHRDEVLKVRMEMHP